MTSQADILDDPNYIPVLDHGFVGIVDTMGDDTAITQAARVSYGAGTKSVREDRGLIRYLFRHQHTSPIEMCEVKFHLRCPIFVMRQLVRHRTSSLNEYSGRYSIMSDEFYIPDHNYIQPQSDDNKQGRTGDMSDLSKHGIQWLFESIYEQCYDAYQAALGERDNSKFTQGEVPFGAYDKDDPLFDAEFPGVARELARTILPVGNYTEVYWKQNLHNLFHLLKLRMDEHAQKEIRVFAEAMYQLIKPIFSIACEAFEDYQRDAVTLSRMEKNMVKTLLSRHLPSGVLTQQVADEYGISKRELREFAERFKLTLY